MFKKVKTTVTTWNGRKGKSISHMLTGRPDGPRVVCHVWEDDPERVEVKALVGSFWRGENAKMFSRRVCYFHNDAELLVLATQMAGEVDFNS